MSDIIGRITSSELVQRPFDLGSIVRYEGELSEYANTGTFVDIFIHENGVFIHRSEKKEGPFIVAVGFGEKSVWPVLIFSEK